MLLSKIKFKQRVLRSTVKQMSITCFIKDWAPGKLTGSEDDFAGLFDYLHVGESFYYKEVHFKSQLPLGC